MDTPVTPNTPFEDVDGPNDLIRNLVTVRLGNASCESSDRVPNIESKDKSMPYCVMNDYDHWVSGKVCAQIYVPCEEAYTEEIRIVDQFQRFSSVKVEPGVKYMFILIDGAIRVYITQEALKSTVSTYIGHSNITQDTGFTLSGVIELSQKVEHAIPFPKEDWNVLHKTLVAVSTSYCRKLTTPEYALTLVDNDFVCRQLSFCGLYIRRFSTNQQAMCGLPVSQNSIFPIFGTLGPAMIKENSIHITVLWESQGCEVLQIQTNISELNKKGCFFLEGGIVPVGELQPIPDEWRDPRREVALEITP